MIVTRFAPSPTGYLHLGHVYSALFAAAAARAEGGQFLLRIEDIDRARCRPEFETAILEDLTWLGLSWDGPVRRQSDHFDDYRAALERLNELGVTYPCFCSRKDIAASANAPHEAPITYPGTCRHLSAADREARVGAGEPYASRLNVRAGLSLTGPLSWHDREAGMVPVTLDDDVVVARKDTPASYHLAVTVDDHLQGVTLVTRGVDLFAATHVHRLLQALLDYAMPDYCHHPLKVNEDGVRYSKRDGALAIRTMRERGLTAEAVRVLAQTSSSRLPLEGRRL